GTASANREAIYIRWSSATTCRLKYAARTSYTDATNFGQAFAPGCFGKVAAHHRTYASQSIDHKQIAIDHPDGQNASTTDYFDRQNAGAIYASAATCCTAA